MAQDNRYTRSMDVRIKLAGLLKDGMAESDAVKIALEGDSNAARKIATWKKNGVYPYGNVSAPVADTSVPDDNRQIAFIDPPQNDPPAMSPDASLVELIRTIVQEELAKQEITNRIEVVRPIMERTQKTSQMKSFRCPARLWELADSKAKLSNMSLNGVVESLLFQWLGCPEELLKNK